MIKVLVMGLSMFAVTFLALFALSANGRSFAQTTTVTPAMTASPTTVPSGAPKTGFKPY